MPSETVSAETGGNEVHNPDEEEVRGQKSAATTG